LPYSVKEIEELKNDFAPKILSGRTLPNPKTVIDGQSFYLQASDGVYQEYLMFKGKWNKKVIDLNYNVILEQV
jgi:hypothetical protein